MLTDGKDEVLMHFKQATKDLLDNEAYFIVEPIFLDNILTSANYFSYTLTTLI